MRRKWKIIIAGGVLSLASVIPAQYPSASEEPDVVELDHLGALYEEVTFDHAMHVDIASCAACHHHTLGSEAEDAECISCHKESVEADVVACRGCHAIDPGKAGKMRAAESENLYHTDTAGLKRAYHLKCMGCHLEMEVAGGCYDCHAKKG